MRKWLPMIKAVSSMLIAGRFILRLGAAADDPAGAPTKPEALRLPQDDSALAPREDWRRPQMKDTIDRPAVVRVLTSAPVWKVPVIAMSTPVDPILTAIKLDRIAYVGRLAQQDGRREAESRSRTIPMRTLTKPQAPAGVMLSLYRG
jgi:hypothetical protein